MRLFDMRVQRCYIQVLSTFRNTTLSHEPLAAAWGWGGGGGSIIPFWEINSLAVESNASGRGTSPRRVSHSSPLTGVNREQDWRRDTHVLDVKGEGVCHPRPGLHGQSCKWAHSPPHPPTAPCRRRQTPRRGSRTAAIVSCASVRRRRGTLLKGKWMRAYTQTNPSVESLRARTYARRLCLANQSAPHGFWPWRTIF